MRYNVGMYGGSFDPLHLGHIHSMIRGASICAELYIVISWCEGRESVPKEMRYRWIYNATKHLPNVKILLVEDNAASKEVYNAGNYWENGARAIKGAIGKPIDAVFCGADYIGTNRFESLYGPESEIVYFDRQETPISSTELRFDPHKHWEYLPPICRPYYVRRVLVVGSESTGKSTLVQNLAIAYNTNFVREIGRDTCEIAGGEEYMNADDLIENMVRQKSEEIKAAEGSNRILFVDTDALTTMFYSQLLLTNTAEKEKCIALAGAVSDINRFDLVLFLEPNVLFVQDGTRNNAIAANRKKYSEKLKLLFVERNIPLVCLDGDYLDRFDTAKNEIDQMLKKKK